MSEDDDLLAAELAFGLLDPADHAEAEARLARDPTFAIVCERWRGHAAAMIDGDEPARAEVWARILASLPANDDGTDRQALRRSIRTWRTASFVLALVAAGLGAATLLRPGTPPPPVPPPVASVAPVVVILTGKTAHGVIAISYDRQSARIASTANGVEAGQAATELWVIPAGGKPRSLGVIPSAAPGDRAVPIGAMALLAPGATLAISLEPAGGSPTGQPTGPVILTGTIARG